MANDEKKMAADGEFLRSYGQKYFCVASEALNIDRVKWTVVPIGSAGKDNEDFYLPVSDMLRLVQQFNAGVAQKKIENDKNNYPSAYQYVTGEDGCLKLSIGGGKYGARLQISNAKTKRNYLMAVAMKELEEMANRYSIFTGCVPVGAKGYYPSLVEEFEKGRQERSKFRKHDAEKVTEVIDANAKKDEDDTSIPPKCESVNPPQVNTKTQDETPKKTNEPPKKTVTNEQHEVKSQDRCGDFFVSVKGQKRVNKGFYMYPAIYEGENVWLLINVKKATELEWFKEFDERTEDGVHINIYGERKGAYINVEK